MRRDTKDREFWSSLIICHPEWSGNFAERSFCGIEGPHTARSGTNSKRNFLEGGENPRVTPDETAGSHGSFDLKAIRKRMAFRAQDDSTSKRGIILKNKAWQRQPKKIITKPLA